MATTRARKVCLTPGCPEWATGGSYCPTHTKPTPHGWGTSKHVRPQGWDKLTETILRRDRRRCRLCGRSAREVDHLLPTAWGGNHSPSNLRALCVRCHRAKTQDESRLGRALPKLTPTERQQLITEFIDAWR